MSDYVRLTTAGDSIGVGSTGSATVLKGVIISTGAASAVVSIWEGSASPAASARKLGAFAATAQGSLMHLDLNLRNGFRAELTGGNADAIVIFD